MYEQLSNANSGPTDPAGYGNVNFSTVAFVKDHTGVERSTIKTVHVPGSYRLGRWVPGGVAGPWKS